MFSGFSLISEFPRSITNAEGVEKPSREKSLDRTSLFLFNLLLTDNYFYNKES